MARASAWLNCVRAAALVSIFALNLQHPASAQTRAKAPPRKQARPAKTQAQPHASVALDPTAQHLQKAETYQLAADFDRASTEYRHAICDGLRRMAIAKDGQAQEELLQKAIAADPECGEAAIDLAYAYFRAGKLQEAQQLAERGLTGTSASGRAHALLGSILFLQEDYAGAAEQFDAAVKMDGEFSLAYGLALAYLKDRKPSNAQVVFDNMLNAAKGQPELYVLIGRAYEQSGYPEQAATNFKKALIINPKQQRANSYLGVLELGSSDLQATTRARERFNAELRGNPTDYTANFNLGVLDFKDQNYDAAERELKAALASAEDRLESLLYLARTFAAENKLPDARRTVLEAVRAMDASAADPRSLAPVRKLTAQILEDAGEHAEAERQLAVAREAEAKPATGAGGNPSETASLLRQPGLAAPERLIAEAKPLEVAVGTAYHNLAVILSQRQQYSEAVDLFQQAARWNPALPTLDRNWGMAAFRAERYQDAIEPLRKQVSNTPDDDLSRQSLGVSYYMLDDFQHAAEIFAAYASALPDNPGVLYAAGISFSHAGKAADAARVFRKLLQQNQRAPEIHLLLGQAYAGNGEFDQARSEFATALQLDPAAPNAHYFTGMAYIRQGNMEMAERELRAELASNAASVDAQYQLGYVLLAEKKTSDAIPILREVADAHPEHGDAQYELGRALLEQGDAAGAVPHLESAVHLMPERDYPYYQLSLAYTRLGRTADAANALQQYRAVKDRKAQGAAANNASQ